MSELIKNKILAKIDSLPRFSFLHLPTPLVFLVNLSTKLGGTKIYIKRDDLTGRGFGGNKSRKLEFIIADACRKNCKAILTWGSVQSNWCFQTALVARRFQLEPILILFSQEKQPPKEEGNLMLDRLLEAEIHFYQAPPGKVVGREIALALIEDLLPSLRSRGLKSYVVSVGGSMPLGSMELPLGAISYILAFYETWQQAMTSGFSFTHIVHATGSGATQAGLLLGAKIFSPQAKVIGISVSDEKDSFSKEVMTIVQATREALNLELEVSPEEVIVLDEYLEGGYGVISPRLAETIKLFLQAEGIVLDPVYTAKAMLGLIDLIERGYFKKEHKIIFFHTGGTPALFAYGEKILSYGSSASKK